MRHLLWMGLCLGCRRPTPPESLVIPHGPLFPAKPAPELIPKLPDGFDIDEVDLLSLIPEIWPGQPGYYQVPSGRWPALAWRAHEEVLALEDAAPIERASIEELVLRFHLHVLAFELSENDDISGPPFFIAILDTPLSPHLLRAAQLLRRVPALEEAELEPSYVKLIERELSLVDRGGPFADEALVLERLHLPYEGYIRP